MQLSVIRFMRKADPFLFHVKHRPCRLKPDLTLRHEFIQFALYNDLRKEISCLIQKAVSMFRSSQNPVCVNTYSQHSDYCQKEKLH